MRSGRTATWPSRRRESLWLGLEKHIFLFRNRKDKHINFLHLKQQILSIYIYEIIARAQARLRKKLCLRQLIESHCNTERLFTLTTTNSKVDHIALFFFWFWYIMSSGLICRVRQSAVMIVDTCVLVREFYFVV